jgi:hypothetical protein
MTILLYSYLATAQAQTLQEALTKSINDNVTVYLRVNGAAASGLSKILRERFSQREADIVGQDFVLNCWNDETCMLGFHRNELRSSSQLNPARSVSLRFPVTDGTKSLDVVLTARPARRGASIVNLQLLADQKVLWQTNLAGCRFVEAVENGSCELFEAGVGPRYADVPLTDVMYGKLALFTARLQGRTAAALFQKLAEKARTDDAVLRASSLYPDGKSLQLYQVDAQLSCIQIRAGGETQHVCNLRADPKKGLGRQDIARLSGWSVSLEPRFQASRFHRLLIETGAPGQKQTLFSNTCPLKTVDPPAGECEAWLDIPYPIEEPFPPFFPPVQGVAVGWRSLLHPD